MKNYVLILWLIAVSVSSCAQEKTVESYKFDTDKLLERCETLSADEYAGRKTGERGNDSARAYIINEFKAIGVSGYKGKFEQPFIFESRNKTVNGINILGEIKGSEHPEKYIVISAHYDHVGSRKNVVYNGADDNASGTSALLSFAEYLVENPPKHSVVFAAFDAEEIGLRGAKHFVTTIAKDEVILNINMDMPSRSPKNELYVVGGRYHKPLETIIANFENPTNTKLLVGHDGTDGKQNWTWSSDHGPFYKKGIPFLYFGNEDHEDYHQPDDDFEKITPQFYMNAVEIILSILLHIDDKGV